MDAPATHLGIDANDLDMLVAGVVLEKLHETDIRARLVDTPDVDLDELRTRRAALAARADELARMFAAGLIDGSQLGSGTASLRIQITEVDRTLAALVTSSPALTLLDGDPDELVNRWNAASNDIRGKGRRSDRRCQRQPGAARLQPVRPGPHPLHPEGLSVSLD